MSELHKGLTGLQEQAPEFELVPGQGWQTFRVWHGSRAAVAGAIAALQAAGYTSIRYGGLDGPMWYVRAGVPSKHGDEEEEPVDTWELDGDALTQDIRLLPAFQALTDEVLADVQNKIDDPDAEVTIPSGNAEGLYGMLLRKQEYFQESRYILRNTFTTNNPAEGRIAVSGVNALWTGSQIFSAYTSVPLTIRTAINSIPVPTQPAGYSWSWLKSTPTLSKSYSGLTSIVTEWTLYLWSTFVYPNA